MKQLIQPITESKWKANIKKIKDNSRPTLPPPAPQPKNKQENNE
jgi:hypothetical protein